MKSVTLAQIAALLNCPLPAGKGAKVITGAAALTDAGSSELSLLTSERYVKQFNVTSAVAVLVNRKIKLSTSARAIVLAVDDAELAMAKVLELLAPPVPRPPLGLDESARVDPTASLGDEVAVGPTVVIGARSRIGNRCVLHAGVYLGDDVTLGDDCELFPHVTVRERITIGRHVIIHANSVLGTDGFGYRWDGSKHAKVPQIGTVIIEDDVEIGSCVCIDRAKFGATIVGRGTKIDNLVQIAHNVQIGPHCVIAGQAGLAGSVKVGTGVVIGGQAAVRDHVSLGDGAAIAARAAVAEDVEARSVVSGMPALPHRQSLREQAALRRLPHLIVQVRRLQEKIDKLKEKPTD